MSRGGGHVAASRMSVWAGVAALSVALVGCAPASETDPTPSASVSTAPSPDATSDGPPVTDPPVDEIDLDALVCTDLLDLAVAQAQFGADAQFIAELGPGEFAGIMAGPIAENALSEATQQIGCIWGIPQSDGAFTVVVAALPQASRDTLTTALGSSVFTGTLIGTAPAYTWERDDALGMFTTVYAFASPLWVTVTGSGTTSSQTEITGDVLNHLRTIYPSLGN
ncbi:hypothetical protein [Microbacterium sp. 67-17]|uniref:hypothetical protein n=1 Tax=Microbacterium sp. 67-17 TaxID=1895782 RepID=UPI0025D87CE8|nr:hypothetical protein [Microbacterium sp. 67-17]